MSVVDKVALLAARKFLVPPLYRNGSMLECRACRVVFTLAAALIACRPGPLRDPAEEESPLVNIRPSKAV